MIRVVSKRVLIPNTKFSRFNSTVSTGGKKVDSDATRSTSTPLPEETVTDASITSSATPPTFFHNQPNLPEKMAPMETHLTKSDQTTMSRILAAVGATIGGKASLTSKAQEQAQTQAHSTTSALLPPPPPPVVPPRSIFSTPEDKAQDTKNYFQGYKDFCKGMAYLGIGMATMFFLFDQYERLDESERQMKMMKKKQADLVAQMQNYKSKLKKVAIDNARQNVITQGKMQMHIALLRKQLEDLGVEPTDIDAAVEEFEHTIKIDVVGNRVELWVPGENDIKRLIPDPHEYNKKR